MNKQAKTVLTLILAALAIQICNPAYAELRPTTNIRIGEPGAKEYSEWPIDPSVMLRHDDRGLVEYVANKNCSRDRFEFKSIESGPAAIPLERSLVVSLESRVKDYNLDPRWTAIATRFFIEPDRIGTAKPVSQVEGAEGVITYAVEYNVCYQVREGVVLK